MQYLIVIRRLDASGANAKFVTNCCVKTHGHAQNDSNYDSARIRGKRQSLKSIRVLNPSRNRISSPQPADAHRTSKKYLQYAYDSGAMRQQSGPDICAFPECTQFPHISLTQSVSLSLAAESAAQSAPRTSASVVTRSSGTRSSGCRAPSAVATAAGSVGAQRHTLPSGGGKEISDTRDMIPYKHGV